MCDWYSAGIVKINGALQELLKVGIFSALLISSSILDYFGMKFGMMLLSVTLDSLLWWVSC